MNWVKLNVQNWILIFVILTYMKVNRDPDVVERIGVVLGWLVATGTGLYLSYAGVMKEKE